MLAFTSVYFFESGLFNGLQPVQIKISDFLFQGALFACQVAGIGSGPPVLRLPPESAIAIRPFRMNTTDFGLWQDSASPLSPLSPPLAQSTGWLPGCLCDALRRVQWIIILAAPCATPLAFHGGGERENLRDGRYASA